MMLEGEVLQSEFPGKDVFEEFYRDNLLVFSEVKIRTCESQMDTCSRFLEREVKTVHQRYLYEITVHFLKRLGEYPNGELSVYKYNIEPHFVYNLYVHDGANVILAGIKGYNILQTPDHIWENAWRR